MVTECLVITSTKAKALICAPWAKHAIHVHPGVWMVFRWEHDYNYYLYVNKNAPKPRTHERPARTR